MFDVCLADALLLTLNHYFPFTAGYVFIFHFGRIVGQVISHIVVKIVLILWVP